MPYLASKPARFSEAVSTHRLRLKEVFERDGSLEPQDIEEVLEFLLKLQGESDGLDAVSNLCASIVKYGVPSDRSLRSLDETGRELLRLSATIRHQMQMAGAA